LPGAEFAGGAAAFPQHRLNFTPEPQGQAAFRGTLELTAWPGLCVCGAGSAILQNEVSVLGAAGSVDGTWTHFRLK
jgi:hypothetical protein